MGIFLFDNPSFNSYSRFMENKLKMLSYLTYGIFLFCKIICNLWWINDGWNPLETYDGYLSDLFLFLLPITVGFLGLVFTYLRFGKKLVLLGNVGLFLVYVALLVCSTFLHDDDYVNPESVYMEEYDENDNLIEGSGEHVPLSYSAKVGLLAFYSISGFIILVLTLINSTGKQPNSNNLKMHPSNSEQPSQKEFLPVLLLCFFFGFLGIHRFFVGKMGTGVLMLLTFGGFGLWNIIDFILILTNHFRDSDGLIVMYNRSNNSHHDSIGAAAEIEKLASLKEKGIISEEQFDKKKRQLLGL